VKGPRSFDDLKTVPGSSSPLPSFAEAARARGLMHDDRHFLLTLKEAALYQMPAEVKCLFSFEFRSTLKLQMRGVFVAILGFNEVSDPKKLWEEAKREMAEDFRKAGAGEEEAEAMAYADIEERFSRYSIFVVFPVIMKTWVNFQTWEESAQLHSQADDHRSRDSHRLLRPGSMQVLFFCWGNET